MATLKNHSFFFVQKCINNEDDNIQESEDNTNHRGNNQVHMDSQHFPIRIKQ